MLPLGPPDRHRSPYKARSAFAAWPRPARRPGRAGDRTTSATLPRAQRVLGRRLGGVRRRGAVADQVRFDREWAALRAYARERGVRLIGDVPIYVARGQRRPRRAPRALPVAASWPACRPTRCATTGQLWGNPLYDWPALQRRGYRWWIERLAAHVRALRPRARSTTSAASSPTGRSRRARRDARTGAGGAARGARCSRPRGAELGRAAADRRGPRRHHARGATGCATRSACRAWSCCSSASTGRPARARTGWRTTAERRRRLHGHARQRHPRAAGGRAPPTRALARRRRPIREAGVEDPSRGGR